MALNIDQILHHCLDSVLKSGEIIRQAWNRPSQVRHKGVIDLVTETDVAVQAFLRGELGRICPEARFVGEEADDGDRPDPHEGLCWIVDPVDGTTNFVHRIPLVGTSVALCDNGMPCLGIVNIPVLEECFYAATGHGAFLNDRRISTSSVTSLKDAVVATGFPYDIEQELAGILDRLQKMLPSAQGLRRLGAASIDLAYVACGRMDAFYETCLKPWDVAGGMALVMEAGGKISNFTGETYKFGEPFLADNSHIHEAMLELLQA